jgi:uncharacterized protein involved in outer membrane biogenesis
MKLIRLFLSIVALLAVLIIVTIAALAVFVDPNRLNPVLADALKKQTGYEVTVAGPCSWSFYPNLGVTVAHIGFATSTLRAPFLDLHRVTFVTPLAGLLHGRLDYSHLYIANVRLFNLALQRVQIGMQWHHQQLLLRPLRAVLYGGVLQGEAAGRLEAVTQWVVQLQATQVALKPLLQDVNGVQSKLIVSGLGDMTVQMMMQGNTREQLLESSRGKATFRVTQGAVEGFDANALINNAQALLHKQPEGLVMPTQATLFNQLIASFMIDHGVAATRDLALTAPAFTIQGTGVVNLNNDTLDFGFHIFPQIDAAQGLSIPVKMTGEMTNPNISLDISELNLEAAKTQVNKTLNKVRDQINDRLPSNVTNALPFLKQ